MGDYYWKWKEPYISSEKEFFNDNDNKASYIEYKVSCREEKDCWYVIVNIDNSDAKIPMSSSSWKTLSELMNSWNKNSKNYYFSPFEQFSENEKTWEINFTNPENKYILEKNWINTMSRSSVFEEKNDLLKNKLDSLKEKAKKFKKSKEFENFQKKLRQEEILNKISNRDWDQSSLDEYFQMKTVSWAWWWKICPWKLPCYEQPKRWYWTSFRKCLSWCWATAFSIIFWYHSMNWNFSWLLPWIRVAPLFNNDKIDDAIIDISKTLWTYCSSWEWAVTWEWMDNISNYIKKHDLKFVKDNYRPFDFWDWVDLVKTFNKIKQDISNNNPIILYIQDDNNSGHIISVFWYSTKNKHKRVNANFWWWPEHSNVNMSLSSVTRNGTNYWTVWYFSLIISY